MEWYVGVGIGVVAFVLGAVIGVLYRKRVAEKTIGSAEDQAKKLVNDAIKLSETKQKEILLEAKEEVHRLRSEADKEIRDRRAEVQRLEKRMMQKEETLDRRAELYESKENILAGKIKDVDDLKLQVEEMKKSEITVLERISGMTSEEARQQLIESLQMQLVHESAVLVQESEKRAKEAAEQQAKEIVCTAIQRYAADYVAEATISVVTLPNDEMKGRIIGREGRNIRALESLTGVDLIVDDTPETITISSFDIVRREVARIALERLIQDGRIHPTRIGDMVEKAQKEVDQTIRKEGENAVLLTGVHGIHPELVKLLGRLRYRTSFGQSVLQHSIEVSQIAGLMAAELGADVAASKRAGLLHDIGKALDQEREGSHVSIGVEEARRYKEHEKIVHAIEAHHGDVAAKTLVAAIVQAADAISAARPGARREDIESYIKRLESLENLANGFKGVERTYAIQAGREIRVMVRPEEVTDDQMVLLARDIANKIEEELEYPGQIKVHVIRESKAVEYAK